MKPGGPLVSGVHLLSPAEAAESIYLKVREKEGRLYPDAVVRALPDIDPAHPLHAEWRIRGASLARLATHLRGPLALLDVGCGNGWMANRLAHLPCCEVVGLDMNLPELEQGARVFSDNPRLHFAHGDLFAEIFPPGSFDAIVLAGSIQYFPDPAALLRRLQSYLGDRGAIHILDSPFYDERGAAAARERTRSYYEEMGVPEMSARYHHHQLGALREFRPAILYQPRSLVQRLRRRFIDRSLSPFPWIRIARNPLSAD